MTIEVLTKEDLEMFRIRLLDDLKKEVHSKELPQWLRSAQVRKLLGNISPGTLQNLRISGVLKPHMVGKILYYNLEEINILLANGFNTAKKQ